MCIYIVYVLFCVLSPFFAQRICNKATIMRWSWDTIISLFMFFVHASYTLWYYIQYDAKLLRKRWAKHTGKRGRKKLSIKFSDDDGNRTFSAYSVDICFGIKYISQFLYNKDGFWQQFVDNFRCCFFFRFRTHFLCSRSCCFCFCCSFYDIYLWLHWNIRPPQLHRSQRGTKLIPSYFVATHKTKRREMNAVPFRCRSWCWWLHFVCDDFDNDVKQFEMKRDRSLLW